MKPIEKISILCRKANMSGYTYKFDFYQEKGKTTTSQATRKSFGLGGSVNEKMANSLIGNTYIMTMSNCYFSIDLYEYLKKYIYIRFWYCMH